MFAENSRAPRSILCWVWVLIAATGCATPARPDAPAADLDTPPVMDAPTMDAPATDDVPIDAPSEGGDADATDLVDTTVDVGLDAPAPSDVGPVDVGLDAGADAGPVVLEVVGSIVPLATINGSPGLRILDQGLEHHGASCTGVTCVAGGIRP